MTMPAPIKPRVLRELALLSESLRLLSEAKTLDEVKDIRDKAEAFRLYTKQRGQGLEVQNIAAEIKIRAERRAGKMLIDMDLTKGRPEKMCHDVTFSTPTLNELGIGRKQSSRWQKIALVDNEDFEVHIQETREAGKELTTSSVLKLAARQPVEYPVAPCSETCGGDIVGSLQAMVESGRKFRAIYADPPWRYGNQATRASTDNHYDTMSVDDICAEPVTQIAEDDAHLHLWTTNAFLFDARRVIEAWGFEYKSCFVWVKPQMGIGNYWRVSHEFLLFGIRGRLPFRARDEMSWAKIDRTGHSAKPDAIRMKVEKVSPGPYLEMYGRAEILNSAWTVYGNQVGRRLL